MRRDFSCESASSSHEVTSSKSDVELTELPSAVRATASLMSATLGRLLLATDCSIAISNCSGPTRRMSPLSRTASSATLSSFTKVPLRLFRSRTMTSFSVVTITQWWRLIASLCGRRWQSSPRPIMHFGVGILTSFPVFEPCIIFNRTCIVHLLPDF